MGWDELLWVACNGWGIGVGCGSCDGGEVKRVESGWLEGWLQGQAMSGAKRSYGDVW